MDFVPYVNIAFAFMAGCSAVAIYQNYKNGKDSENGATGSRMAALLSSSNNCFYYRNLTNEKEWFSRKLRDMFALPAKPKYSQLLKQLPAGNSDKLEKNIAKLLNEEVVNFTLEIEDVAQKRFIECYGVLVNADRDKHLVLWWRDVTDRMREWHRLRHENERTKLEMRQLSNMVNALPIPIWQRNEDFKIRYCNLAYLEAAEEVVNEKGDESLEIYPQAQALAVKAIKLGKVQEGRRHVVLKGERKLFDFVETPWEDRKNLTGIAIDKEEVEKLNLKLQDVTSTQNKLLESITSSITIFGADQRIRYYNQAAIRMWKLDSSFLNQNPSYGDVLEKMRDNRVLPEQANFPAFKQRRIKMFTDLLEPFEEFYYLPDSRIIRQLAIPDAAGGILFADEDVTDRMALERSYNTLIAVQSETLNHLMEGIAVFGQDGRLKLHNPVYREMWDLSDAEALREPHMSDLLDKQKPLYIFDDWDGFKKGFIERISSRKPSTARIDRSDSKVFDVITVPLPDGQTLVNYVDLTDSMLVERSLREKNEALEEADRLKSEFLANVSYELRSPLTSISGFYEMLNQAYVGSLTEKQSEYVDNIGVATQHLITLIDDILDIASIEAGYLQLEVSKIDILTMLTAVQSMVRDKAEEAGLTIEFDCPMDIGEMDGDQIRIKQALFNLMSNAIKYTDKGGEVTLAASIETKEGEEFVRLVVKDSGVGISEDEHEAVFDKFYRTTAASRKSSGTGLGLAMVKSFVELHGGYLQLDSKEGEGTSFACIIPRYQAEDDIVIPLPNHEANNDIKH